MDNNRMKIGGLWLHQSANGSTYYSGNLFPGTRILIFTNGYKQPGDNQPDLVMYISPVQPPEGTTGNAALQPAYQQPAQPVQPRQPQPRRQQPQQYARQATPAQPVQQQYDDGDGFDDPFAE